MIEGNKAKGDSFEKLALAYFRTDPKFQNIKNVWHHRDIPYDVRSHLGLPTNDIGIDILLESVDGEYYPVQCKFHSDPNRAVGWKEASTFIGILNSNENFKAGYLSSNAFEVSSNYDKAISGKPIVRLLGSIWDTVDPDPTAKTREALVPLKPRPHQEKAINDAIEYFVKEENSRGKLIFPCGAGKSLTGFWITQKLDAKSILVAVPSLALVKQTLEVYLREIAASQKNARWLCVCSDKEIGSTDEVKIQTSDLGVPCTTDPNEIRNWLQRPGEQQQIVFTTYQSGRLVADIAREENIAFDLAILDEAHKTVGSTGKLFSYLLFDQNVEIRKRIFMTATERFYSGSKDDIVSMDDPDVYGEVFTQMTFKEAINLELLTDYKIITIDVAKKEIADFIRENKLVELDSKWGKETEARSLAAMIALRKAMKALPIRNAVSFHSSIAKAERNDKLQKHITEAYKLPAIASYTVSGKMSTGQRDRIVNEFASKKGALITNARCLTEGVDVPNIDCIVFADPRKSRIDIVQALGRALRRKEGKDWGYVILPVVYDGDTHEIDNDNFQEIVSIIRGLAANDERIVEYFKDKQSIEKTGGVQLKNVQLEFLTEILEESQFQSHLQVKVWEGLSRFNWLPFSESRNFARSLKLSISTDWRQFFIHTKRPHNIPSAPNIVYKDQWLGWGDFLGNGNVSNRDKLFKNYEDAKSFARGLGLKSEKEWRAFNSNGKIPDDIPSNPSVTYKSTEWEGWPIFLGNDRLNTKDFYKQLWSYEEAKKHLSRNNISSQLKFLEYKKSPSFPKQIPRNPNLVYSNLGQWINWGDFLSSGRLQTQLRKYKNYDKARKWAISLNLKSESEWRTFKQNTTLPLDIPSTPDKVYANKGWNGFGEFLGYESKIRLIRDKNFEHYRHLARKIAKKLGVTSRKDWNKALKNGLLPKELELTAPDKAFKEWSGWADFLGSDNFSGKQLHNQFLEYGELKKLCFKHNIKSSVQYKLFWKKNHPTGWPAQPQNTYKIKGEWRTWGDFLNTRSVTNVEKRNKRLSFILARNYIAKLKFNGRREYWEWWTTQENPIVPKYANDSYKNDGWISWPDFLGYDKKK